MRPDPVPSTLASRAAVAFAILAIASAVTVSAQEITEFPVPTASGGPLGIAAGPDGALWFTEETANKIGRITTDGVVTEFPIPTADSHPRSITPGPDGALWFTESWVGKIGRIAAAGSISEFALPSSSDSPWGITAGPDGALWFTTSDGFGYIGRITTEGAITQPAHLGHYDHAGDIVAGPDGALWFRQAGEFGASWVARITTTGTLTRFPAGFSGAGIAFGSDGNLWFTQTYTFNKIGRMTTSGVVTTFPIPTPTSQPRGIAAGWDGDLWFTEFAGNKIGRISTLGVIGETIVPTSASGPQGIAAGPDGAMWFTETNANRIGRITTTTAPLTVLGVTPSSGPASGGTPLVVTGTGFLPSATLTIGGVTVQSATVVGPSEIDAVAPVLLAGTLNDVVVADPPFARGPSMLSASLPAGWLSDFLDVPQGDLFHVFVESIFRDGITAGYGNGNFGRDDVVTRAQMAVFLVRAEHGSSYAPPACAGVFADVPCPASTDFPYSDWIERLSVEGVTGGCFVDPLRYCPDRGVRRDEMAALLLKTEHGPDYQPPPCAGIFADVPCTPEVGFSDWIERLANEGVTGGCFTDPIRYCPDRVTPRGEMAVFLVKTFALQ